MGSKLEISTAAIATVDSRHPRDGAYTRTPPASMPGGVLLRRVIIQSPLALLICSRATGIPPPMARQQQRRIHPAPPHCHRPTLHRYRTVNKINVTPGCNPLQPCSNEDQFFEALNGIDVSALEATISENPDGTGQADSTADTVDPYGGDDDICQSAAPSKRRGPNLKSARPFVMMRLWCLYPGTGAPSRMGTLYSRRLGKRGNQLAILCGFTGRVPCRKTTKGRFETLDKHPDLIMESLRAVSEGVLALKQAATVHPYLIPPDPEPQKEKAEAHDRTAEINRWRERTLKEGLGQEEFDDRFRWPGAIEEFLLNYMHDGHITCHKCQPNECRKHHNHGLTERRLRRPCPDPDHHDKDRHGDHRTRREWSCRCCRAHVSVTSGTFLERVKLPLRKVLRCIYNMVDAAYGVAAIRMGRRLNSRGRTMRHGTILQLMHRIRKVMRETHPLPFEGKVEIDEAFVKLKDGVVCLLGAYDTKTRRVYIEIIDGPATKQVMRDFIERVSLPGSRVDTDGTAAWPDDIDRIHGVVIHKHFDFGHAEELMGKGNGRFYITTDRIEGSWGLLKRALRIPVSATSKYFPLYLAEAMWRINHVRNRLEAESYVGEDRRVLALMGQLLANGTISRLTTDDILVWAEPDDDAGTVVADCDLPGEEALPQAA